MIRRAIVLSPEAEANLLSLYEWLASEASPAIALRYIERLEAHVRNLDAGSHRGTRRDDVRPGLRTIGFERRVTIAFTVSDDQVTILGFFYGGQNWMGTLAEH